MDLVIKQQASGTGLPAVTEQSTSTYQAGSIITQTILLQPTGTTGSTYSSPVGFSHLSLNVTGAVQLTGTRAGNTSYLNQVVNQSISIDDTVDSFVVANTTNAAVTAKMTYTVAVNNTTPIPSLVISVNGMTGAVTVNAANLPGLATVAKTGLYTDLAGAPVLAPVATSGSYTDLTNKPTIPAAQVNSDWNSTGGLSQILNRPTLAAVATSGLYSDLTGKPTLATVATSGLYSDLLSKPALKAVATTGSYADLLNVPTFATVATSGLYSDLTGKPILATVATSGSYVDLTNKPAFAVVATSGSYTDLLNKPVLAQVASSGLYSDLVGAPTLAVVATSGSYTDLLNKPALKPVATTGAYADLTGTPTLATVALSGSYTDLLNKPAAYSLPAATAVSLGGVKIGAGITVTVDGTISASTGGVSSIGLAMPPDFTVTNNPLTANGTLIVNRLAQNANTFLAGPISGNAAIPGYRTIQWSDLPVATTLNPGVVRLGSGVNYTGGALNANVTTVAGRTGDVLLAATDVSGLATVARTGNYSDLNGLPSPYVLPTASGTVLGGIKVGANLSIDGNGVLSAQNSFVLQPATSSVLGGVKIGANVSVAGDGTISVAAPYTLPVATSTVLGGVKQGTNVSVAGDGTLSVATASSTVLGLVKGGGTNITIATDGTLNVPTGAGYTLPIATTSVVGGVQVGNGLAVTAGGLLSTNIQTVAGVSPVSGDVPLAVANITGAAPLASPTFTGAPVAPTPTAGDQSTKLATTQFAYNLVSGVQTVNVAGGVDVTLTPTQYGAGILLLSGALTANINLILPAQGGNYTIYNGTTGGFTVTAKASGATGTTVAMVSGQTYSLMCDGTNVRALGGGAGSTFFSRTSFSATAGQTTFNVTYPPGALIAIVNGAVVSTANYAANDGATVVFNQPLDGTEEVVFLVWTAFAVANALPLSGGTMAGPITLTGNDTSVTQATADSSTKLATTAFVHTVVASVALARAIIPLGNLTASQVSNTDLSTVGFTNQTQVVSLVRVDTGASDQYQVQIIETVSGVETVVYQSIVETGPMKDLVPFTIDRTVSNSTLTLRVTATTATTGTTVRLVSQGV